MRGVKTWCDAVDRGFGSDPDTVRAEQRAARRGSGRGARGRFASDEIRPLASRPVSPKARLPSNALLTSAVFRPAGCPCRGSSKTQRAQFSGLRWLAMRSPLVAGARRCQVRGSVRGLAIRACLMSQEAGSGVNGSTPTVWGSSGSARLLGAAGAVTRAATFPAMRRGQPTDDRAATIGSEAGTVLARLATRVVRCRRTSGLGDWRVAIVGRKSSFDEVAQESGSAARSLRMAGPGAVVARSIFAYK